MPTKNSYRRPHFEGYRVTEKLNDNAFSQILLAERTSSNDSEQPVVIKWLYTTSLSVQQDRDRFLREVDTLKNLHYPYILPILAAGIREEDHTPYLVMEYAPNGSLSDYLQERQALRPSEALAIVDQVGQALHYVHQWNITHGNLKPGNILFNAAGDVLLADFHLSSLPSRSATSSDEESVYAAPEQLVGKASQQSDVYALGCVTYEMLTGHKPFVTPSTIRPGIYYRTRKPTALRLFNSLLPQSIEDAVLKAIAREPELRHRDIPTFLAALRGFVSTVEEEAREATLPTLPMIVAPLSNLKQALQGTDMPESRAIVPIESTSALQWGSVVRSRTGGRPRLVLVVAASLLVAGMIGIVASAFFSAPAPRGRGLAYATSTASLQMSPQVQTSSTLTPSLTPTPGSTPPVATTVQSVSLTLTPVPTSAPTVLAMSTTSSSSSSGSSSTEGDSTPTAVPVVEPTATPVSAPQPTPTPVPQPTATPTPRPTPTPTPKPANTCKVAYSVPSQWQGGFGVNMVMTNTGSVPINGWILSFTFQGNQRVTSGWGGRFSQQGNRVIITDNGYNAHVAAGASVTLGFLGTWAGNNSSPTAFTLNGMQCH